MNDDISKKTRSSLYWNVGLKIPYEIFRFIASIITARILDPEDFGIVSIATMVILYAKSFTNFGFNQVLVQRKEISKSHINTVFTVDIVASIAMGLLVLMSSERIALFFNSPESIYVIRVMSIIFILTTLHDLPYVVLRRELEFKLITIIDMAREIGMTLITLTLALNGYAYWSIVYGHIISMAIAAGYLLYKTRIPLRLTYNHQAFKELAGTSIWSFLQMQIYFISNRIDRIVIGRYFNTAALGLYEKAKSLSQMPSESLGDKLNTVFFSSFSRSQDSTELVLKLFQKGLLVVTSILFPVYIGILVTADHFVIVLLGRKWAGMIDILQIMSVAGLFASINGFLSALAVGAGYFREYTLRFGLSTLALFIGCVLVADGGIVNIAIIYSLYTILLMYLSFSIIRVKYGISWRILTYACLPAIVSSVIMGVSVQSLVTHYLYEYTFLNFMMLALFGASVYIISMAIMPSMILNSIRQRIYSDIGRIYTKLRINK